MGTWNMLFIIVIEKDTAISADDVIRAAVGGIERLDYEHDHEKIFGCWRSPR